MNDRPTFEQIFNWIHLDNPYNNFDYKSIPFDSHNFTADPEFMLNLVLQRKPNLIIEVGSFKGGSARAMAEALLRLNSKNSGIICIDTWLGAREFYVSEGEKHPGWWKQMNFETEKFRNEHYKSLNLKHGYPQLYYQFLANVMHDNIQHLILPFAQTSLIAARWLKAHDVKADLIYIDGSHDYSDVLSDLNHYWELLDDNALLFGDDYWITDVKDAVDKFVEDNNLKLNYNKTYYWLEK